MNTKDDLWSTRDSCVVASFEKQSCASSKDTNLIEDELGCTRNIKLSMKWALD